MKGLRYEACSARVSEAVQRPFRWSARRVSHAGGVDWTPNSGGSCTERTQPNAVRHDSARERRLVALRVAPEQRGDALAGDTEKCGDPVDAHLLGPQGVGLLAPEGATGPRERGHDRAD